MESPSLDTEPAVYFCSLPSKQLAVITWNKIKYWNAHIRKKQHLILPLNTIKHQLIQTRKAGFDLSEGLRRSPALTDRTSTKPTQYLGFWQFRQMANVGGKGLLSVYLPVHVTSGPRDFRSTWPPVHVASFIVGLLRRQLIIFRAWSIRRGYKRKNVEDDVKSYSSRHVKCAFVFSSLTHFSCGIIYNNNNITLVLGPIIWYFLRRCCRL